MNWIRTWLRRVLGIGGLELAILDGGGRLDALERHTQALEEKIDALLTRVEATSENTHNGVIVAITDESTMKSVEEE